ncbi:DNA-directed RNA polymerase subunit omega [Verrucomicrobia bacterium LW23]|nr:DNA-directed RNA polymerase subunit omega [Verrucomicrobia bacterium LW23]
MKNILVQDALKKIGTPQTLVNLVSKRVKQLGQGYAPLVHTNPRMTFMDIALQEITDGKLTFESLPIEPDLERPGSQTGLA